MCGGTWWPFSRCWVGLFCVWLITGCATSPGRSRPPQWAPGLVGHRPQVLLAASDAQAASGGTSSQAAHGYNAPGRSPNSQAPWELFLGNAAHRLIAYIYGVNHPTHRVFYNNKTLVEILQERRLGVPSRLLPHERTLRPDITDVTTAPALHVFEIKPWHDRGLQEGRQELQMYLAALNRAVAPQALFTGGANFQGQILVRFARGQYIWRLEWQTSEPGITQYRWTRSQQRFESERAAYDAGQWVDLTVEEMRQYGGWVGQAVEEMVTRRERLATFSGAVGIVIDIIGESARGVFTGVIIGRMSSGAGAQTPPAQGGGQLLPFPARPTTAPAQLPAASGM